MDVDLGAEVCRARPRPQAELLRQMGFRFPRLLLYVLGPCLFIPYTALMVGAVAAGLVGVLVKALALPAGAAVFVLVYAVMFYYGYIYPGRDCLVLHERGLHVRIGFKRRDIPFESIQGIVIGRALSRYERTLRGISRIFHPEIAAMTDRVAENSVRIMLADGKTVVFKTLLIRFDGEETVRVLEEMFRRNPRLAAGRAAGASGVEPLAT